VLTEVESGLRNGSVFNVKLPQSIAVQERRALNQPVTIVMIEEGAGHARLIERNIRRAGDTNDLAHFGEESSAMDYFNGLRHHPESMKAILVLLDLNLPDISGFAVLDYLKKDVHFMRDRVIFLTTADDRSEIKRSTILVATWISRSLSITASSLRLSVSLVFLFSVIKVPGPLNA
jgi:DNA-binding NarL/FixJ family response regulator